MVATLPVSPAMVAGVTDRLYGYKNIVGLL